MQAEPSAGAWLEWLESTAVAITVRESAWTYPAVETAHIFSFVVLVGAALMFDLRLLGVTRKMQVTDAARHLLGWSRLSLLLVVPSGLVLFMTQATMMWANPVFRLKLVLIALAGVNALVFHLRTFKSVAAWDQHATTPAGAKIAAVLSLALWTGVITCGRFLAYF